MTDSRGLITVLGSLTVLSRAITAVHSTTLTPTYSQSPCPNRFCLITSNQLCVAKDLARTDAKPHGPTVVRSMDNLVIRSASAQCQHGRAVETRRSYPVITSTDVI